jgi:hypothetical protein
MFVKFGALPITRSRSEAVLEISMRQRYALTSTDLDVDSARIFVIINFEICIDTNPELFY